MTIITPIRTQAEAAYISQFPAFEAGLTTRDPAGLKLRRAAFERFVALGLPHRRIEPYHYTDVRALLREVAGPAVHAKHLAVFSKVASLKPARHLQSSRELAPACENSFSGQRTTFGSATVASDGQKKFAGHFLHTSVCAVLK